MQLVSACLKKIPSRWDYTHVLLGFYFGSFAILAFGFAFLGLGKLSTEWT